MTTTTTPQPDTTSKESRPATPGQVASAVLAGLGTAVLVPAPSQG